MFGNNWAEHKCGESDFKSDISNEKDWNSPSLPSGSCSSIQRHTVSLMTTSESETLSLSPLTQTILHIMVKLLWGNLTHSQTQHSIAAWDRRECHRRPEGQTHSLIDPLRTTEQTLKLTVLLYLIHIYPKRLKNNNIALLNLLCVCPQSLVLNIILLIWCLASTAVLQSTLLW